MKTNENVFDKIKGGLVVSCQALPEEPLHSSFIMGKMAYSAMKAGAKGIRANSVIDIQEIKKNVDLPIIGLIKQDYESSDVFITPTMREIDQLVEEGVDVIALDATKRIRPDGKTIREVFPLIKEKYKDQLFMADCSTYEEAKEAYELGFDCLGTTLCGYTEYTSDITLPNMDMIERLVKEFPIPIIAEGGIWTPEQLKYIFELGVDSAVVGSAITRPMEIAKRFIKAIP